MNIPQYTLAEYENDYADRHLLHGVVAKWATDRPDHAAIIEFDTGREVNYREFDETSTAWALRLLELGYRPGDFLATMLPLTVEHIFLEYACFKIGVIHAPLDLRLKPDEVIRSLGLIEPRGFVTLGRTALADFSTIAEAVRAACGYVEHLVQFADETDLVEGAIAARHLTDVGPATLDDAHLREQYDRRTADVRPGDGAQVIYTTGSTGFPKPALLSHRNITAQNLCLAGGFDFFHVNRMLVNLPPSHVGCQAEALMTSFFTGSTAVIMHVFDAERALRAIERYRIDGFGQVPAMFQMQWRLPNFDEFDLSSLRCSLFGGQTVTRPFVQRLHEMTPLVGTGLGLTEMSGFVTYTGLTGDVEPLVNGVGWPMPITPLSIREPMNGNGTAGQELAAGETGEICFSGPQVFIDYVGNREAYRNTVTSDGICYTGDLGYVSDHGLIFTGRSKLVIKPKGYQVHPAQIEQHFAALAGNVASCAAVGQPHEIFSEAIMLFVTPQQGCTVRREQLEAHAQGIAAYMRPTHYVILEPGAMPLNRVAKTDYVSLKQRAAVEVERLRAQGKWDNDE
ncbi:MAG: class I adenylate-forming enzyme family protein [Pirellulales bacterium]|nr:acyl--CoA ligase [Planctomycetales bacterium]